MIKPAIRFGWLLGFVAFGAAGLSFMVSNEPLADVPQKAAIRTDRLSLSQEQLRQVSVATVQSSSFVETRSGVGQVAFNEDNTSSVVAPFSGRVTRILVKAGDEVKRGEPLFELESPEIVQAQTDLIAAVHGLSKARAQLALAKRTLERQASLLNVKAVSQRDFDVAQNDHAAASSDIKTAESALRAARNRLRVVAGRSEDEITRVESEQFINPTITVNAPIGGTIVSRKIGPGQYVRSDLNEPLFQISDLSTMWLKAAVPENDIPHVRIGQEIEVRVAALPDRLFKARVSAIGAASDTSTRRIVVRAELPNPDRLLRGEMFAAFKIRTGTGEPGPGVPSEAVIWDGDASVVWVRVADQIFQRRQVKLGRQQEGLVQIRDGLIPGDAIVARGAIFIDNEWKQ
jgi:cobalt-zinc-cadmium efflux system membrane fusion protein